MAICIHAHGDKHCHVLHLATPRPLQPNAVQIHVGVPTLDRPVPPGLDLGVDLLIQLTDLDFCSF